MEYSWYGITHKLFKQTSNKHYPKRKVWHRIDKRCTKLLLRDNTPETKIEKKIIKKDEIKGSFDYIYKKVKARSRTMMMMMNKRSYKVHKIL